MGLYDRDYSRYEAAEPRFGQGVATKPAWLIILIVTVVAYFVDALFFSRNHLVNEWMSVSSGTLKNPALWWQWLTYGLAHDPNGINHILFNMLGLFFFGSAVEPRLGRNEFLRFYIVTVFLGGLVWSLRLALSGGEGLLMGASGGVLGVCMLFVFMYPNSTIYLMMVLPVKAWVVGVIYIGTNLYGAWKGTDNTAYDVHLVGIACAAIYHFQHINLGRVIPHSWSSTMERIQSGRPKLKLHDPEKKLAHEAAEADRILQKIHESGEASLTSAERKLLEQYSRRMRDKR